MGLGGMETGKFFSDQRMLLAAIAVIFLLIRIPLLTYIPFISDETVYSMMIEEQVSHPSLVPTFLGYEVGWKPPLFFWVYGALTRPLLALPLPLEAVYRLPTVLFGLLNSLMVFLLVGKLSKRNEVAFFTALIYAFTFLVIFTDSLAMTDTLAMSFILASILAYLSALENPLFFILAGFLSFLAFFTKQINAAVAPVFMAAYLFQFDRKKLLSALFLLSLLFVPAAFLMNYLAFKSPGQAQTVYADLISGKILNNLSVGSIGSSAAPLFLLASVWLPLSLFGFVKYWRENIAMSLWYLLTVFPLVAGTWMPFYFLPVMPAIAYFSCVMLLRDEKGKIVVDRFFLAVLAMAILASLIIGAYLYQTWHDVYLPKKEAGELLAFKENTLIIGDFPYGVMSYKTLTESRKLGHWLDFGWIFDVRPDSNLSPFLVDYHAQGADVVNGSFGLIYFEARTFRKDTNITHFDYVAVVKKNNLVPDGTILYNRSNITVYRE